MKIQISTARFGPAAPGLDGHIGSGNLTRDYALGALSDRIPIRRSTDI